MSWKLETFILGYLREDLQRHISSKVKGNEEPDLACSSASLPRLLCLHFQDGKASSVLLGNGSSLQSSRFFLKESVLVVTCTCGTARFCSQVGVIGIRSALRYVTAVILIKWSSSSFSRSHNLLQPTFPQVASFIMKPCGLLSSLSASDILLKNIWQVSLNEHPQICSGKHNSPKVIVKGEERADLEWFLKLLIGRRKARKDKCPDGVKRKEKLLLGAWDTVNLWNCWEGYSSLCKSRWTGWPMKHARHFISHIVWR